MRGMPRRQGRSRRPQDHSWHLGSGRELSHEAAARFQEWRAHERGHGAARERPRRRRSASTRGLLCSQAVAREARRGKAARAAKEHCAVPGLPSAELRGRHVGAAARRAQLRVSERGDARLRKGRADQQSRHAGIHASAERARSCRDRALSLRAVTFVFSTVLLASFALLVPAALGQSYPSKPLRLIVPFSAGGSSDVLARGVARQLGEQVGEPVVVENRAGAGGMIALEFVAKAPTDGYTLLFGTIGTNGIGPALYKNLAFDPVKDLAGVSSLHTLPNVVLVNAAVPAKSMAELIALAKARPGSLTFASAGSGPASHLSRGLPKSAAGLDNLHGPDKGGGTGLPEVVR